MGNTSSHQSSAASTPANQPTATLGAQASSLAPASSTQAIPSSSRPIPQTRTSQPSPVTPPGLIAGGHLHPQNPHALGPGHVQDYNDYIVTGLILRHQLAPFYRGLEDYEVEWSDAKVVEELKNLRLNHPTPPRVDPAESTPTGASAQGSSSLLGKRILGRGSISSLTGRGRASSSSNVMAHANNSSELISDDERYRREAEAYRGAVECPICFLYYPPNINTSRCCQQPVCTECFTQMKRSEATVTHLDSEVVSCPFCVEPDFGVIYEMKKAMPSRPTAFPASHESEVGIDPRAGQVETARRKSVSHTAKEVVTIDQIRPDWEEKLNAVKAASARRASRRIVMRQVGDRMIPIGFTSSRGANGETGPVGEEELAGLRGPTRRRRGEPEGMTGSDLEELMLMEAMRLSMVTHEEDQRRLAEEAKKKERLEAEAARRAMWAGATIGPSQASCSRPPQAASSSSSLNRPSTSRMLSTISSAGGDPEPTTIEGGMSEAIGAPLERRV